MRKTVKQITDELQAGVKDLFNSENMQLYLKTASKFHTYSANNVMLIMRQMPNATLVAGYRTWQTKFNRHVLKGAKGIEILAPIVVKNDSDDEKVIRSFRITHVFDVSQTQGDPLPQIPINELGGSLNNFAEFKNKLIKISKYPIYFRETDGTMHGYFDIVKLEIVIRPGMSEEQTIKTMIHEIAHSRLHNTVEILCNVNKQRREIEAESIAYTVCSYFGIDTSDYSFGYLAGWGKLNTTKTLQQSLVTIQKTASSIIDDIENLV